MSTHLTRAAYASESTWYAPVKVMQTADGEFLLRPAKPIQKAKTADVAKWTGIPARTLHRLAEVGLIRREQPTPRLSFFFPAEIMEFLEKTQDPEFWERVKLSSDLRGDSLRFSWAAGERRHPERREARLREKRRGCGDGSEQNELPFE